jgi:hypothetical protein
MSRRGMHNADRWKAYAKGIVRKSKKEPVLLAFDRTPVAEACFLPVLAGIQLDRHKDT